MLQRCSLNKLCGVDATFTINKEGVVHTWHTATINSPCESLAITDFCKSGIKVEWGTGNRLDLPGWD